MPEQVIICTLCPLGCHVTLTVSDRGKIGSMTGHRCKEGKKNVTAEFKAPVRIFTATVVTEGGDRLLPVRTDKPVLKSQLKELMRALAMVRVEPPVRIGQVIIHDILGTGANLIATSTFRNR